MTSGQAKAVERLKTQIRVALARKDWTYADLGKQLKISKQLAGKYCRHPEMLNLEKWALLNSALCLDPANFNAAANFVRGGETE